VVEIKVDEIVKNLSSVKVGDKVVLNYFKSIAYRVSKPGDVEEIAVKAEVKRVGAQTRLITKTATIQDIDRNTNNVVLKGPEGNLVGVNGKDPKKLENVQVGDQVVITCTEALAISLEKATTQ
jgi:ribosomal 50S subunit-recycling heat shock protein